MPLPVPTPAEVEQFKQLVEQTYGEALSGEEALDIATAALQIYYIQTFPAWDLRDGLDAISQREQERRHERFERERQGRGGQPPPPGMAGPR